MIFTLVYTATITSIAYTHAGTTLGDVPDVGGMLVET